MEKTKAQEIVKTTDISGIKETADKKYHVTAETIIKQLQESRRMYLRLQQKATTKDMVKHYLICGLAITDELVEIALKEYRTEDYYILGEGKCL